MAVEQVFIYGDIFKSDHPFIEFQLQDAIDQQEWVTVWQIFLDFFDV